MRRAVWALMAVGIFAVFDAAPVAAGGMPFCIQGCDFGAGDCSFATYQQCLATASGRDASCAANPYFSANPEMRPRMSRRRY